MSREWDLRGRVRAAPSSGYPRIARTQSIYLTLPVAAVTSANDSRQALQPSLLRKGGEITPQEALVTTPRVVRCMVRL
jgi:hypothetical protein